MHPRRRWAAALAASAALLCLGGCTVDATFVIHADDTVTVDVESWQRMDGVVFDQEGNVVPADEQGCSNLKHFLPGLQYETLTAASDFVPVIGCRATGTTTLAAIDGRTPLVHVGDRYVLFASPTWRQNFANDVSVPPGQKARPAHLSITFPGPVESTDSSATVDGTTVTWSDIRPSVDVSTAGGMVFLTPLQAIAYEAPNPFVTGLISALGAIVGAAAVVGFVRRRRKNGPGR
ncbi:hypothetical protein [Propioniciclava tarda]|uniref:LPXTG cell wall anchor domain-containing protein n=1 Tax=Propioniciclava tarda TaxID=433330 RepID=A0A4V6MV57_PROTD|nr:hypothetical protein [Propioniciclava tarda]TBT95781.1 hypothetical protein ET996_02020 [Propioniciclava tarda]SMO39427.1 hypothetical protein SAMN06266982_10216 [Propioniciclava tarda]